MRKDRTVRLLLTAVVVGLVAVGLGACGSSGGSSSSTEATETEAAEAPAGETGNASSEGGSETFETGGGPEVTVPKEGLNIGLFMVAESNLYQQQVVKGAEAAATKGGAKLTDYDAEFEPTNQINQIQNALQQGEMNAVILHPTSGELLCTEGSKTLPEQGIPVVVIAVPICGHEIATGEESAQPGIFTYVDSVSTKEYINGWLEAVAEQNPGNHTIALVAGPEIIGQTKAINALLPAWEKKHPNLHMKYKIYTDYTTPDALTKTQAALKAHSDIEIILSVYSPDLTQGVVKALEAEGENGEVAVDTLGASKYDYEQIENGNVQFTIPQFPFNLGYEAVKALTDAQSGEAPPRFIDDSTIGSAKEPLVITKANLGEFEPQY
jgi:ribose transport system substrate-binding protein